jgi:hypothetical protein
VSWEPAQIAGVRLAHQDGEMSDVIDRLLGSEEPCVRDQTLVQVLGQEPDSPAAREAREEIRSSPRIVRLLSPRRADGRIPGSP